MELYPFYDFLLVIFGLFMIIVSVFIGNHKSNDSTKKNVYRFGAILGKILVFCFGVFWILLPWIYRKMGIYVTINIEMIYLLWGLIPAFIGILVCIALVYFVLKWVLALFD
ncbi:hypothetical protein J6V86_02870 [bacterium]|nr:hypothetical protein [bacterium]